MKNVSRMSSPELMDIICRDYACKVVPEMENRYGWSHAYEECWEEVAGYPRNLLEWEAVKAFLGL